MNSLMFLLLEERYQIAKRKAERLIRRSNRCTDKAGKQLEIMETSFERQKAILKELGITEEAGGDG